MSTVPLNYILVLPVANNSLEVEPTFKASYSSTLTKPTPISLKKEALDYELAPRRLQE